MIEFLVLAFFVSFCITYISLYFLIPKLIEAKIVGIDINKEHKYEVAEMGGIAIVLGLIMGMMVIVGSFTFNFLAIKINFVLAALLSILILSIIGIIDDLLDVPQVVKAFLPLVAGIPLIALKATESTKMIFPFLGEIDFGIFYLVVLIPVGISVAANLTNMLAGFNGLEAGMGIVALIGGIIISYEVKSFEALSLYTVTLGALISFFLFNKYPAKVFPGDVGTLTIGAVIAVGSIIGNFESYAALLLLPHVVDFFIKAANKFPSKEWWGENRGGKLYPLNNKVRGFAQLIMKIYNGISEKDLVKFFIILEAVVVLFVLILFFLRKSFSA